MHVGNRLTDHVVEGEERPLGAQRRPQRRRDPASGGKQRAYQGVREIGQRGVMRAGHDQRVAGEQGPMIEKGEKRWVVEDDVGAEFPAGNSIEDAFRRGLHRSGCQDAAMSDQSPVSLSTGLPETVLPPPPPAAAEALAQAEARPEAERLAAVATVAGANPKLLAAWATLAEGTEDPVASYAYARVGYHRGLDALRAAGWRGSGLVRWRHETNRGFLRALDALRRAAGHIGETEEEVRCDLFLHQLDPDWDRRPEPGRDRG
jgi:hypothetical protein